MKALLALACIALALGIPVSAAGLEAPIGHRQPTAADVPADDSVRSVLKQPDAPGKPTTVGAGKRRTLDPMLETPDICANCFD